MQVNVKIKQKCPACNGAGYNKSEYFTDDIEFICSRCKGTGFVHVAKYIDLDSFITIINRRKHGKKRT